MDEKYYWTLKDIPPAKAHFFITPQNQMTNALLTKTQIIASRLFGLIEGYVYTARGHQDSSIYTGYSGIALIHFLIYKKTKDINSFKMAKELTDIALTKLSGVDVSFLTGDAGPLALGIILNSLDGDTIQSSALCLSLIQLGQNPSPDISCALIDGWAGYLYALLFVNKHAPGSIPYDVVRKVVMRIIDRGMKNSSNKGTKVPLVFEWKGLNYRGALYGTCGILYVLMCSNVLEEPELSRLIQPTVDDLVRVQKSTNFSSHEKSEESLVQWDLGAAGYVPLFIKASEMLHHSYLGYAKGAASIAWKRGLLKKGYSLCHGVPGNAYSFLSIYRKTNNRRQLLRAMAFMEWCLTWPRYEDYLPDRPFSLFKGYSSLIYFFNDMRDMSNTAFPGYEL
ncbi:Hypothetical protein NTJ_09661 [Nesidiocoris tenuis]|uniref:LanC-like protein 2 n=1 Tax=Nesidiocoris tenuis TaxID=355587 RepID=A0ABN7AY05_9HEMI|nr:Hypothetical protein NTJ_09661 [Nesidiocoris tenuis]